MAGASDGRREASSQRRLGIWVLGDQLHAGQAALASSGPGDCRVLLLQSLDQAARRRCHRQKLVLVWSAMRHFAAELRAAGWVVDAVSAESYGRGLRRWIEAHGVQELRLMEPADRGFRSLVMGLLEPIPNPPELVWVPSNAFLWSREAFAGWAGRHRQLRMESFYRDGRRRFGVLMEGEGAAATPMGGRWNFDKENRRPPRKGLAPPPPLRWTPDAITAEVIEHVASLPDLPGSVDGFGWPVTRAQALEALEHFIATRLADFGTYQDAMVRGQPTMWHALLSSSLNLGLLQPLEVIRRLEQRGLEDDVPLNALEGVIRQILGWREYTHGLHHWFGEDYGRSNALDAHRPLPDWLEALGGSGMACMDTVLGEIRDSAYAHHIQRLMILGNYGLLAGLDPQAFTGWFRRLFIDSADWVMETNVIGMALHADGGRLASKPYAASGSYVNRMSDYCRQCRFKPKQRSGEEACPFTSLYWDFLARHRDRFGAHPRMALVYKQLEKIPAGELEATRAAAARHLQGTGAS
ncbi:cryptochrome/photolyase family protein [Synechococcus sp. RSCCF101]|uniref:cryptochrome/photolyase family protein n=1 Tax=Synechococcus sp. RSCCF101 TaxID=2511069 RepID=UPI001248E836|nr:cryptochrome/photolyase family protein [Synechococcus sp. RSCCF101]QEY31723.1 cryptochrome/photolyase family protein [Synechococcus sp. RSCCF101]